jgi:hypothetical protein
MLATVVSEPVDERLDAGPEHGVVLGGSREVAYLRLTDFVIALTGPGVDLMPNGIAIGHPPVAALSASDFTARPGCLRLGALTVEWSRDTVPVWNARPSPAAASPVELAEWGAAVLSALGVEPSIRPDRLARAFQAAGSPLAGELTGRLAIRLLLESLLHRDPSSAEAAAVYLVGRGTGLTPEGDDVLAACAAAVALLGAAVSDFPESRRMAWLLALRRGTTRRTTTALATTLLDLAGAGCVTETLHALLSEASGGARLQTAAERLRRTGGSTGLAYGLSLGAAALVMARCFETTAARGGANKETARC